jgi:hypothetical protein
MSEEQVTLQDIEELCDSMSRKANPKQSKESNERSRHAVMKLEGKRFVCPICTKRDGKTRTHKTDSDSGRDCVWNYIRSINSRERTYTIGSDPTHHNRSSYGIRVSGYNHLSSNVLSFRFCNIDEDYNELYQSKVDLLANYSREMETTDIKEVSFWTDPEELIQKEILRRNDIFEEYTKRLAKITDKLNSLRGEEFGKYWKSWGDPVISTDPEFSKISREIYLSSSEPFYLCLWGDDGYVETAFCPYRKLYVTRDSSLGGLSDAKCKEAFFEITDKIAARTKKK